MKYKWYLAYLIEFPMIRDKKTLKLINYKKYLFWENLILIKASNPNLAYSKAIKYGKDGEYKTTNTDGNLLKWKFGGVSELVEVGNSIGDKQELTFTENFAKNFQLIRKLISPKNRLSVFKWNEKLKKEKLLNKKRRKKYTNTQGAASRKKV